MQVKIVFYEVHFGWRIKKIYIYILEVSEYLYN